VRWNHEDLGIILAKAEFSAKIFGSGGGAGVHGFCGEREAVAPMRRSGRRGARSSLQHLGGSRACDQGTPATRRPCLGA
jgi:hypothetical protein